MDSNRVFDEFAADFCRGHKIPNYQFYGEQGMFRAVFTSNKPIPSVSKLKAMIKEYVRLYELDNDCSFDLVINAKQYKIFDDVVITAIEAYANSLDNEVHSQNLFLTIADHNQSVLAVNMSAVIDIKCEAVY